MIVRTDIAFGAISTTSSRAWPCGARHLASLTTPTSGSRRCDHTRQVPSLNGPAICRCAGLGRCARDRGGPWCEGSHWRVS